MKQENNRMPKADYFRKRYQNALDNNLTDKAKYYEGRLIAMNEPTYKVEGMEVHNKKIGKVTQHDIVFERNSMNDKTIRIYSAQLGN